MEKYGVLREYACECGYCILMRDNETGEAMVKQAGVFKEGHAHLLLEVKDGQRDSEGSDVRSKQPD
jgi:hypothetical protein